MTRRMLPAGHAAVLVECDDLAEVLALHDALAASAPVGVVELVPAARTLLVAVDPAVLPLEVARGWIRRGGGDAPQVGAGPETGPETGPGAGAASGAAVDAPVGVTAAPGALAGAAEAEIVVVPVDYRGDDLHETAELLGVSPEALVGHHTAATWRVAFIGFAPGFGYLVSDDWPFQVPRLDAPRTRVPSGSVALAGAFAGAYPRESPGGWRLVGRTDAVLWDAASEPPALFAPARRVRFEPVRRP